MIKFKNENSFLENLGFANLERMHTEFLAWLISDKCNAVTKENKLHFLSNITEIKDITEIKSIQTEIDQIDLLVETDKGLIVLENKIKSSQHSNQLEKYRKHVSKFYPNSEYFFIFLTLAPEVPHDSHWKHISYSSIYPYLEILSKEEHKDKVFIEDYILNLSKILASLNNVIKYPEKYDSVFENGKLKKSDKTSLVFTNNIETFICENQLETIFQKAYLSNILNSYEFSMLQGFMTETRGTALLDFPITENISINDRKEKYRTFIQLQGSNIKFALSVQKDYSKSHKNWISPILETFKKLKENTSNNYTSYNPPISKAYVSVSKKTIKPYWKMPKKELSELIKKEIAFGKGLSKILIENLK
ncbi:PD-(D/E)XK nuclease family protein [Psychroserpens jangbogonensis]|uniref:PD-(D/E)XK nuclease family protein n=1 Tax=Psychroserpens jangbogonensis TaxID=1484460 RepID=UPI00053DABD4|nr:PD-(D/E)XK nuclease family protein [Psychroserpens jangbogonensis]